MANSLQLALPLYCEKAHVLAKAPDIWQITDLNGKRVSMGDALSPCVAQAFK